MKKRILIMISVMVLIAMVGCSQETVEVITSTTRQPTTVVTTTTATTFSTTITTTQPKTTTTKPSTKKVETTTTYITTKPTTKKHTVTKPSTIKRVTTTKKTVTTTKNVTTTKKPTTTKKVTTTTSDCIGKNDHWMPCGNVGKWYNSKEDFKADYFKESDKWADKLESGEIDWDTYINSVARGYEIWSCPNCRKWTGNYHYK